MTIYIAQDSKNGKTYIGCRDGDSLNDEGPMSESHPVITLGKDGVLALDLPGVDEIPGWAKARRKVVKEH